MKGGSPPYNTKILDLQVAKGQHLCLLSELSRQADNLSSQINQVLKETRGQRTVSPNKNAKRFSKNKRDSLKALKFLYQSHIVDKRELEILDRDQGKILSQPCFTKVFQHMFKSRDQ